MRRVLMDGGLLSLIATLAFGAIVRYNPRLMINDYPKDIRDAVPAKTAEEKRLSLWLGIPLLLVMLGIPVWSCVLLRRSGDAGFVDLFVNAFGVGFVFNVVDLVIIDWLVFCLITPALVVIPGTEGMSGYKNYAFHFRAFLKGTVLCAVTGLVTAGVLRLTV